MSLPRYPEYRNSEVEWLGRVPGHWRLAKIRSFTRFRGGGTPSRENPSYWNGDIPWVSPKDMKAERIVGTEERITEDGLAASTASTIEEGNLLIVVRSGILKHTIPVAINDVPVALNQDMKVLSFDEGTATVEFFLRWIQGLNNLLLLVWAKQGATVESIEHAYLADTIVALPRPEEQIAITSFLDRETAKIDALIAEQEKLIALLAEKRQATISHAVTRGLDPNAPMKDSGVEWLGEVPVHWEVLRLGVLFREVNESGDETLPVLSVSIHDGVSDRELDDKELDRKVSRSEDKTKYKVVAPGDLTYNMMRAWQGGFGSVIVSGMVSPAYVVARPVRDFLTTHVEQMLRTPQAVSEMKRHSRGVTDFRLRLYWEEFKTISVALPPKNEQMEIETYVREEISRADSLTRQAFHSIDLLKERRSALISAAVTGQIDVRGLAEAQAA